MYTYIYSYKHTESKSNFLNFPFPQNGYNVSMKAIHILNAPSFTDDVISLLKREFDSKLAEKVRDFNRLNFSLVLSLL